MDLKSYIREIQDFPKPGISYKDISPLLQHPEALSEVVQQLSHSLSDKKIDKVVGVESRGFIFGSLLANTLQAGFVPVRKPGKLPGKTLRQAYDLEYGTDCLEIHTDAIKKGDRVVLHDDILATGGTAAATAKLISKLGGTIIECNMLIDLPALKGKEKLKDYSVRTLITY